MIPPNKKLLFLALIPLFIPGCGSKTTERVIPETADTTAPALFSKSIKDMTIEQASKARDHANATYDMRRFILTTDRMLVLSKDSEQIKQLRLDRAKAFEILGQHDDARGAYELYLELYPGSADAEFAHFKIIEIGTKTTNAAACDQSKTQETIKYALEYFSRYGDYAEHAQNVKNLLMQCQLKLLDCEMGVCSFYLHTYYYSKRPEALQAAKKRLADIRKSFKDIIPQQDLEILLEPITQRLQELDPEQPRPPQTKKSKERSLVNRF